jgi:glycosyltransferase involved in cell wall biosynthesis
LRILMVARGVTPLGKGSGGAELVAAELAENFARRGEEVVLVSDIEPLTRERMPAKVSIAETGTYCGLGRYVKLIPMNFPRWLLEHLLGNVLAARRARMLLKSDQDGFDVIHVHGALATVLLRQAVRTCAPGIPLIYTEHDSTPWSCRYRCALERMVRRCVYRQINLRACRVATVVTVNFPSLADELAARTGLPRSHFATIRNAATARWLSRQHDAESVKVLHGLDRYILFVGSLVARKCPDILLRALARVPLPCIFVGDGPMRASLERLASRFGIADRVVFTGALDHRFMHRYYAGAEALVLPSVSEGVPLVALEALGAGVPVVASNLHGIASFVRDQENGLLVEPGDEDSLARALSALEADESLRAKLRHGAESSGRAADGWPDVVNQLCTLYVQHRWAQEARTGSCSSGAVPGAGGDLAAESLALPLPPAMAGPLPQSQTHG